MSPLNILLKSIPSATALGNHVWQSTLFIGACWLAARLLKHNRASIRYSIWLAASVKFLFPFSILIGIGAYAGEFTNIRVVPEGWSVGSSVGLHLNAVEPPAFQTTLPVSARTNESGLVQGILVGWLSGVAGGAIWFIIRWRRLTARIGKVTLLRHGRELDALRRVQSRCGWAKGVRLASLGSS